MALIAVVHVWENGYGDRMASGVSGLLVAGLILAVSRPQVPRLVQHFVLGGSLSGIVRGMDDRVYFSRSRRNITDDV